MFSFSFETVWLLLWLLLLLNMPSLLFYFQALFRSQCFFFNSINTQIKGTTNQRTKQINIIVYEYAVILVIHNYGVYVSLSPSLSLARDITWLSLSLSLTISFRLCSALVWAFHKQHIWSDKGSSKVASQTAICSIWIPFVSVNQRTRVRVLGACHECECNRELSLTIEKKKQE